MMSLNPLLLVGGVIGTVSVLLLIAYACVKDKKTAMGFERSMADGEILRRLFGYAKPYLRQFVVVGFLVLFSISYDIASPLIVGYIEELVVGDFELKSLYVSVAVYAGVLVFSMASTYLQAVILQRVGQRIISDLREDLFTHIESLSHGQLNDIPVGKLVTRVTNDTNAISMMFTNLFVNLTKNAFVILGILVAMLFLNYELTLMVLCFVPFILLFTVIFRKFSRRANRKLKNATTDINTYLSENLSGIKVTQIFGREDEKMEDFRQKSQKLARANQEQIFVFSVFRPLVYMLYVSSILCLFYLGGMGHLNNIGFLGQMKCRKTSCHTASYNHCIIILFHFISSFPLLRSAYFVTLQARAFLTAAHVRLKFPVRLTELHSPRFPVLLLICPMSLFSYLGRSAYFPLHKTSYPGSAFSALRKRQARLQRETRYLYLPRHI